MGIMSGRFRIFAGDIGIINKGKTMDIPSSASPKDRHNNMNKEHERTQEAPLVSFIIPYHNEPADMLRACISSITSLSLTRAEREIIVIDDGSDHCPVEELHEAQQEITYVRQENAGLSAARNHGLELAQGQYIQFVDADDYLIPCAYNHCLGIVRQGQPEIVQFEFTRTAARKTNDRTDAITDGASYLSSHNLKASAWSYLFMRNLLGDLRFIPQMLHEDEAFTPILFLKAKRLCHTHAQAYFYRSHGGRITTKRSPRHLVKRMNDVERIIMGLNQQKASMPGTQAAALQRRVAQLTMGYLYEVMVSTRSVSQLEHRVARLKKLGLFPLPDKKYTWKYSWFRRLSSNRMGRSLLVKSAAILRRLA